MKYDKMVAFARHLPMIRRQVQKDLALPGLPPQKVVAMVVRLLEAGMMRVGNEEYARQNNSFGVTTLRAPHVGVTGPKIRFEFRGESGVQHSFDPNDRRLAKIIRRSQDLPGHELFKYIAICAILPVRISRARIFALGRELCWPPWHCVNLAERKSKLRKKILREPLIVLQDNLATLERYAANPMSIPR